jgi:hypothetical protein
MTQPAPLLNPKRKPRKKADEGLLLHRFGTDIGTLSAANILQAAKADMQAKEHNRWLVAERALTPKGSTQYKELGTKRPYSFFPKHTKAAPTPLALLKLAYEGRADTTRTAETSIRRPRRHRHLREPECPADLRSARQNRGGHSVGRG